MKCRRCGAEIRPGTEMCSSCGSSAGRRRRAASIVCRHCGRRVRASGRLCPACGVALKRSWRPVLLASLAIVLLGAGYFFLARVVTIDRIRSQAARLSRASLVSLLPAPTPTLTRVPTQTAEPRPSPTHIPTATAFATPTRTPTAIPTATVEPSATLRPPTATSAFPYPAVVLLAPANGSEFAGGGAEIILSWQAVAGLAEGDGYEVSLRYQAGGQRQTVTEWVRDPAWRVPADVYGRRDAANPTLEWSVRVARPNGTGSNLRLSPPGETWTLAWRDG